METMTDTQSAVHYISRMYKRITKIRPSIIHRNETVYYCFLDAWTKHIGHKVLLVRLVYKAIQYYPDAAFGLVDRLVDSIPIDGRSAPELCWAAGYFQRIIDENCEE